MSTTDSPKILFVAPSAYTLSGLATWLDYLLPGLRARGWSATLGLVAGARHHCPRKYLQQHPDPQSIAIPCRTGTPRGRCDAVASAIRCVNPSLVVSVNIPDSLVATAELRMQGLTRARAVMACHGIQRNLCDDMRVLSGCLDAVVCVNRLACRLADTLGGCQPERVFYAECGTELPPSPYPESADPPFCLGYVGRLEQTQKRVSDLPAILDHLQRLGIANQLLVAGDGPEQDVLQRNLAAGMATGNVRMLGHVAAQDVAESVYAKADFLLVTSSWETGPIVIWEAMARGVIVVSSRYVGSGLQGILKHEENCLLFEVGDTAEAARQIARLAADRSLRSRLRTNALSTVQARLTTERSVEQWDAAFRQVLELPLRDVHVPSRANATAGRLDRWLGAALAERLRSGLGRRGPDTGPGGEWPHTWSGTDNEAAEFWELARRLDRGKKSDAAASERPVARLRQ